MSRPYLREEPIMRPLLPLALALAVAAGLLFGRFQEDIMRVGRISSQVAGLFGEDGAGKATLMRLAAILLDPGQGSLDLVEEEPRQDGEDLERGFGHVHGDGALLPGLLPGLLPYLQVDEVLEQHCKTIPARDEQLAMGLADPSCLEGRSLTGVGQPRRVVVTHTIAHRTLLLLLDEPADGLDSTTRRGPREVTLLAPHTLEGVVVEPVEVIR